MLKKGNLNWVMSDELIFKICSEYTHRKQLPWDWNCIALKLPPQKEK